MFLVAITDLSEKSKVILQIELILSRYKKMTKRVCSPPNNGKNVVPGSCVTLPNNGLKEIIWWTTKLLSIETEFIGYISV